MKKEPGIFSLLVVLCVVTSILNPRFISPTNLTNMANIIGLADCCATHKLDRRAQRLYLFLFSLLFPCNKCEDAVKLSFICIFCSLHGSK